MRLDEKITGTQDVTVTAISQSGQLSPATSQPGQLLPARSQTGQLSLAISQIGHSSPAISQTGQSSRTISQTGHSSPAMSQTGQSSRTISQTGHSSPAMSQTGQSSHTKSQTGQSSHTISQTGQSNDFVSGNSQNTVATIVSSVFRHVSECIDDKEAMLEGIQPLAPQNTAATIVSSVFRHVSECIDDREAMLEGIQSLAPQNTAATIVSSVFRHVSKCIDDKEAMLEAFPDENATESITNFARKIVNSVITGALTRIEQDSGVGIELDEINAKLYPITKEAKDTRPSVFEMGDFFIYSILSEAKRRVDQIKMIGVDRFSSYTSVEDFKVKDGLEIVARCISTWSFNPHWYFKIIYNGRSVSDTYSYYYTVRWSAPSLSYPVAQVAADIYFVIEVFPMTPPPVHIQVCFRLETDCSNRCALKTPFLEKWIHTVIKRKLEAFQMFTF